MSVRDRIGRTIGLVRGPGDTGFADDSPEAGYLLAQHKRLMFIVAVMVLLFISMVAALSLGAVDIPFFDTMRVVLNTFTFGLFGDPSDPSYERIVLSVRMPRIILCILTGASLGLAGAVMQGLLRNPLVSPFTLGVSTAASFGAAMAIVFGTTLLGGAYYTSYEVLGQQITIDDLSKTVMSFVFGMASLVIILGLTRKTNVSRSTLILSGVIVSYIFQAGLMFLKYISDDSQLRDITMWLMGGLSGVSWGNLLIILPIVLVCGFYLEKLAIDVNMLSSGDDVASNLGVDVRKLRNRGLILSTLISSICIAFTGTIGFIGLMAPHLCRMVIGNDSRYLFPASAVLGALILMVSDIVARVIMRPSELPVGIIMYVIGGIFFIWLVFGKKARTGEE